MAVRLSESGLWERQRSLYHQSGVEAWNTDVVPHYVTNNPIIGAAYADVCVAQIEDLHQAGLLDPAQPLCIVEMGGGSGRLAYYVLKRLDELRAELPLEVRYVLSDFTTTNLAHWAEHPRFAEYLADGRLDLALFSVETDREIDLQRSGLTLDGTGNPVFFIANYVFDSISADCFRVTKGVLEEALVEVTLGRDQQSTLLEYSYHPAGDAPYGHADYDAILREYRQTLGNTHLLFPSGPLRCLENLRKIGGERVLLLAADKGWTRWEDLIEVEPPHPVIHGTEFFSLSVNFHAMAMYWGRLKGQTLISTMRDDVLDICCFSLGLDATEISRTRRAFFDKLDRFGPLDYLNLRSSLRETKLGSENEFRFCLEMLRLSGWDPETLYELSDTLIRGSADLSLKQKRELLLALARVWDNYFPIGESRDLPFEIARLLFRLEHYEQALGAYQESLRLFGEHKMTHHNMGMCHYYLRRLEPARECFQRSLQMDPNYGASREWLLRLEPEISESLALRG